MELSGQSYNNLPLRRGLAIAGLSLVAIAGCGTPPTEAPDIAMPSEPVATAPATSQRQTPQTVDKPPVEIRLVRNSNGDQVKMVQRMLVSVGCDIGSDGIDGWYRKDTIKAAAEYQRNKNLEDDGATGPITFRILQKSVADKDKHCGAPSEAARKIKHTN